ncbi:hypothetical protein NQ315_013617, partial [Exocentrus adspersus]
THFVYVNIAIVKYHGAFNRQMSEQGSRCDRCQFWNRCSSCRKISQGRFSVKFLKTPEALRILFQVAALARRKERLDELASKLSNEKGQFHPIKTDMSEEADILNAFKWIKENLGPIHILINNTGTSIIGVSLHDGSTEDWQRVFQVNVMGLGIATREAIRDMRKNNVEGHIIHMNSIGGHQVFNFPRRMNVYFASKFAVTALMETLSRELDDIKSRIKVTSVSPGVVDTELITDTLREDPLYQNAVKEKKILYPEDVAECVFCILSTPPHVQVTVLFFSYVKYLQIFSYNITITSFTVF